MTRLLTRALRMFGLGCLAGLFVILWEGFLFRREWNRLAGDIQRQK